MKSVALYLICILSVIAATELIIHKNNGSPDVISIDAIQSITFDTSTNPDSPNLIINKNDNSQNVIALEDIQRMTFSSYYNIYKVYVAYQAAEKVGVINGETGEVIKEVDVNVSGMNDNPHYVVIDEINKYWYVTLLESGYVLKYDLITDELVSSIQVGNMPALMEIDSENHFLYVSRFMPMGSEESSTLVHRIHTETLEKDSVNVGASSPHGIALSSDGSILWVASNQSSHFFKIETSRFGEDGYQPENFKIDPNIQDSYNFNDGNYDPLEVELSIDGSKVFISCSDPEKNEVRAFDAADPDTLVASYTTGESPWHMVVVPDGSGLYTTNRSIMNPGVSYINFSDNSVSQIESEYFDLPHGIGISGDGSRVFVTSSAMLGGTSYLHVINTSTNTLIESYNLGENVNATGMAVMQNIPSNSEYPIQTSFQVADFESAEACASCHPNHYAEWSGSMHAYALKDPVWFALHQREQDHFTEHEDVQLGQFCIMCHSPVAFLTGAIPDPASFTLESSASLPAQIQEGITCSFCHSTTHVSPKTVVDMDAGNIEAVEYILYTDNLTHIKYGPIEDPIPSTYHESSYHPDYDRSEYCQGCHNMTIDGKNAEVTFDEWSGTAFQAMGIECQSCHMETYSGYAADTLEVPDAPYRENLHRHYFAGLDQALTEFNGEEAKASQREAIEQLLATTADMSFIEIPESVSTGDTLSIQIGVSNNAGHNLPSGVTFTRQLWLEVTAVLNDDTFYQSGHLNENDDLYDFYIDSTGLIDPDLTVFNTVLYNAEGDSGLLNVAVERMDHASDYTIPTSGSKITAYEIPIPNETEGTLVVSARLRFRALPPFLTLALVPDADVSQLTIFDIDSISAAIPVYQQ